MEEDDRIIVLIDMDCFYCQVEEKLNPELKGKPIAVVQYNPWKGGGIIAVNYMARDKGVTRQMRGDEAKEVCPDIQLPTVPSHRGKADISKYREAGKRVAKVLQRYTPLLERASIDEAYLDITAAVKTRLKTVDVNTITASMVPSSFFIGYTNAAAFIADVHNGSSKKLAFDYEHAKELLVATMIVNEIRAAVYKETGYQCSAGISSNKILSKLVCGMNKPDKQTILAKYCINILYSTLSLKKVRHLGGKFGDTVCNTLKISKVCELQAFTQKQLQAKFDEKNGSWLYNIARGIDLEPVQAKFNPKSIGCCKQFRGKNALSDLNSLKKWLADLGDEIEERLEQDALESNRTPKQMVVSFSTNLADGRDVNNSRSYNFCREDELCSNFYTNKALELVMDTTEGIKLKGDETKRKLKTPITFLGISVGKFEDNSDIKKVNKIKDYFSAGASKEPIEKVKDESNIKVTSKVEDQADNDLKLKRKGDKQYIFQKYFQSTTKVSNEKSEPITNSDTNVQKDVVVTTLENQESFFARLLNRNVKTDNEDSNSSEVENKESKNPSTPVCDILNYGENSNDTEYSGSTINMEINKSIALFDEDPEDVDRVSSMRQLLNSSTIIKEEDSSDVLLENEPSEHNTKTIETKATSEDKPKEAEQHYIERFQCPDCKETVTIDQVDTHADYHIALKLRDEERQHARLKRNKKSDIKTTPRTDNKKIKTASVNTTLKNENSSISSFLVKIDNSVPTETCTECGKRVPTEKYAEHLDFHEAQKLNRELNKKSTFTNITDSKVKRKRLSNSPVKKTKVPCKSIDSFFK